MRFLLKLVAVPLMLALSLLVAVMIFLFEICAFLLTIAAVIMAVLGIGLFFTPAPLGGFVFLLLAFLLSPYGLQAVAASLIGVVDGGKIALRRFLVS
ncbi:CD1845 family protein [[Clostridium] symbiosum]|uniref:CD1845 family protein n=1 Tax=Clostridium symbiosum TaxID=1512 RepID=UPI00189CDDB3|nr:CD1845 family protein [[Clostridium] symbiosum]